MSALVWFRSDLRITDNRTLHTAHTQHQTLHAVFHDTPAQWKLHGDAPIRIDFIRRSVERLAEALAVGGVTLHIIRSDRFDAAPDLLAKLADTLGATELYFGAEHAVNERRRDAAVAQRFHAVGLKTHCITDATLFKPGTLRTGTGGNYRVFTPFKKRLLATLTAEQTRTVPAPWSLPEQTPSHDPWPAGEQEAQRRLAAFSKHHIAAYHEHRDLPALPGTSQLSPYLVNGLISPRQCLAAARRIPGPGSNTWISELIWREFYRHVLVAFPRVSRGKAFQPDTEAVQWRNNPAQFHAWCTGQTGIPIVDAAMRQLLTEGWMHNRLRMVTAQFLSKNLLIDWRWGERFFMEHLIDGDLANNNGGWQWSASTGTDAAPYFRVFNPTSQSRRFDADGVFIRRYVPELAGVTGRSIHDPAPLTRASCGYPLPIVDLKSSRQQAIDAFKALRS
ncbi:MAG: deoxyribodipyrimidine photo-lyase [Myxococcota bacterium]|nr:deoxyribodipyrimidine photo-lyase [Myxococcota bacterium]